MIMNTIHQQNQALIQELGNYSQEFNSYAKSVKDLFFNYVQICLHRKDEIYINEDDVYNIKAIIDFFEALQYTPEEDKTTKNNLKL